ncbi:MAG: cell division topological specificity factor MinE [Hungatella sp.]
MGIPLFYKKRSGDIARRRLKLMLVSDKANCSPEIMEMIKDDMIHVISKYLEIDSGEMEVGITKVSANGHSENQPSLYANIPIRDLTYKGTFS